MPIKPPKKIHDDLIVHIGKLSRVCKKLPDIPLHNDDFDALHTYLGLGDDAIKGFKVYGAFVKPMRRV